MRGLARRARPLLPQLKSKNGRPERTICTPGVLLRSADDLVLEVFALDLAADLDLRRQERQRNGVQLVAGDVGAAQVDVVAVKADDLIIPGAHRPSPFRFSFIIRDRAGFVNDVFA